MSILKFQKPDEVIMLKSTGFEGTFEFRPLEQGFGLTVGNALRRVLLSSLEGIAITSLRIEGVDHEFSTISGVVEDVSEIILNLKQVRLKQQVSDVDYEEVRISLSNKEKITAGDFQKFISNFQILNSDLVICNLDSGFSLDFVITISKGRGYVPSEENKLEEMPLGTIAIDSIHTPIKNVKYNIENYRVEQKTDYEKLIFYILTDGSVLPKNALKEGAKILMNHFILLSDENISVGSEEKVVEQVYDEEILHMRQLLNTRLLDMELSVRALNCLKYAEVNTLGDLVSFRKEDLMKFRNFGRKSLIELETLIKEKDLEFGMDLLKYDLDKD